MRYNDEIDDLWDLNTYSTVSQYLNAVDRIVYNGSGTLTGQALNYTLNNKFSVAEGRRPNVPLVVIVLTDGKLLLNWIILHTVAHHRCLGKKAAKGLPACQAATSVQ